MIPWLYWYLRVHNILVFLEALRKSDPQLCKDSCSVASQSNVRRGPKNFVLSCLGCSGDFVSRPITFGGRGPYYNMRPMRGY